MVGHPRAAAPGAMLRAAAARKKPYQANQHQCYYSEGLRSVSPWYREANPIARRVAAPGEEGLGVGGFPLGVRKMHYLLSLSDSDHMAGSEGTLVGEARSPSVKATTRERSQPTP